LSHQLAQAFGQEVPRDAETGLKFIETPDTAKTVAQDQKRPAVANDRDCARHRTGFFVKAIHFISLLRAIASASDAINSDLVCTIPPTCDQANLLFCASR
jgi:hypothetical protein